MFDPDCILIDLHRWLLERVAADMLPTYFVRELVAKSEEIVVARPAEAGRVVGNDVKFVASEVLKGRRIRVGQTITVPDLSHHLTPSTITSGAPSRQRLMSSKCAA